MRFMDDWRRRREYARRGAVLDEELAQQTAQYPQAARMADEGLAAERMIREDDEANWRRLRLMPVPVSSSVNLSPAGAPAGRAMNLMAPGMTPQRYDAEFGVGNQAAHDANMLKMGRAPGDFSGGSVQARERRLRDYLDRQTAQASAVMADDLARTRSRDQVEAARVQGADAAAITAAGNAAQVFLGRKQNPSWQSGGGGTIFRPDTGEIKGVEKDSAAGPEFQGHIITDQSTGMMMFWDGDSYHPMKEDGGGITDMGLMVLNRWADEAATQEEKAERGAILTHAIRRYAGQREPKAAPGASVKHTKPYMEVEARAKAAGQNTYQWNGKTYPVRK